MNGFKIGTVGGFSTGEILHSYPNPYQNAGSGGEIHLIATLNSPLIISGKGKETRDFTFVGDLVNILIRLVESKNINDFSIFNIGTGIETEIKKLSTLIIDLCDSQSEITYISSRDWDQTTKRKSNNLKLLEQFDLEYTPLEIGLEKTIKWYKSLR